MKIMRYMGWDRMGWVDKRESDMNVASNDRWIDGMWENLCDIVYFTGHGNRVRHWSMPLAINPSYICTY